LESITLLKRSDDQQEGTVTSYKLFQCRRGRITKTGEPISHDMTSDHRASWHIPRVELDRVGVNYINAADRIVDYRGRYWQPESTTPIEIKIFENQLTIPCLRIDPPNNQPTGGI